MCQAETGTAPQPTGDGICTEVAHLEQAYSMIRTGVQVNRKQESDETGIL